MAANGPSMGIFEEVAAAQKREREREERFARITADFATLARSDQVLLLGKLANMVEGPIVPAGASAAQAPVPPPHRPANGSMRQPFLLRRPAAVQTSMSSIDTTSVTAVTKQVVQQATEPVAIDEIIRRVLLINSELSKPEIYSAVYKAAKRGQFNKDDQGRYTYNADYRRGGGGDDQ